MNESNTNFDELKRLLKLKRHEVPPPGYFHNFSSDVVARIRAGDVGDAGSLAGQIREQVPWLVNFFRIFQTKPVVIGGAATSLCLLLLMGVLADRPDSMQSMQTAALTGSSQAQEAAPTLAAVPVTATPETSGIAVSTNPVISLQPVATLFGQQQNPLFQAASFAPGQQ